MIFNSISYAIFLLIVFVLYWSLCKKEIKYQNLLLLIASYVFYAWWDYRFVLLIIASSIFDYNAAIFIDKTQNESRRKILLYLSIAMNLGFLFFFKYFNFFIDTANFVLSGTGSTTQYSFKDLFLPIGISFYTFQALSYTIDVYKRKLSACRNPLAYFAFVCFFPQIAAGPIERAVNLLPKFTAKRTFNMQQCKEGLRLILWGVFKKVAVADMLSSFVDIVYQSPQNYSGFSTFISCIFFTIQVYCDFSGYSDMALGSAKLFGITLSRNFNTPFFSKSLTEFWSRWHITLNLWFRDYVYIPLGGSKQGNYKHYRNVFYIFLISGLWHGASWKYVVWGGFTGVAVVLEIIVKKALSGTSLGALLKKTPAFISVMYSFGVFAFSMIFFRANSFKDGLLSINQLTQNWANQFSSLAAFSAEIVHLFLNLKAFFICIFIIVVLLLLDFIWRKDGFEIAIQGYSKRTRWMLYYLFIIWLSLFGEINDYVSFVYFQF